MGTIFSRKVQKTSKDILEELEKHIQSKTSSRRRNQQYERSFVSYLLLISFSLYLVGVVVLYLYFRPSTWPEWLVCLAPLILFPLVVYLIKKLLNFYFSHRKTLFDQEIATLHEEKRKVLNEVMEKETYKTAIELLQRFEPTHPALQRTPTSNSNQQTPPTRSRRSEVRRRVISQPHPSMMHQQATPMSSVMQHPGRPSAAETPDRSSAAETPGRPSAAETPGRPSAAESQGRPSAAETQGRPSAAETQGRPSAAETPDHPSAVTNEVVPLMNLSTQNNASQPFIPPGMCLGTPPGPPTPCPILPRNRSSVDKVVEYLVGDGPNNRYALICENCYSHNGMALHDEFEYTCFRCAYCFHLNSARKKKPTMKKPPSLKTVSKKRKVSPSPDTAIKEATPTEVKDAVKEDSPLNSNTELELTDNLLNS